MSTYKNAVCKGSIWLGNGCGVCERCEEERTTMSHKQQHEAEKADTFVATEISSQAATSPIPGHVQGLPVAGYAPNVDQWKVDIMNANKLLEERVLRRVDELFAMFDAPPDGSDNPPEHQPSVDKASVMLARRHFEDGFYRLNRAVMRPKRIKGDLA
jgi:hypothetical protein